MSIPSNPVMYCGYCCVMCKTYFDGESDWTLIHTAPCEYDSLSENNEKFVIISGV